MRNIAVGLIRNRQGAALALVAVSLVVILGMGALAVDMGMLLKQREEAQRAADAAALAGASAFQEGEPLSVVNDARDRAFAYLAKNYMGHAYIDTAGKVTTAYGSVRVTTSAEGTVIVLPDSQKVRVVVRRPAVGTLFARVLGFFNVAVAAKAAAVAASAGGASCLMPFAIPDIWDEKSPPQTVKIKGKDYPAWDANGNRIEDGDEHWSFDDEDRYLAFDPSVSDPTQTGYGSSWRNGTGTNADFGRQVMLKPQSPGASKAQPSNFYLWTWDDIANGAGNEWGIDQRIRECYPRTLEIETPGTVLADTNTHVVGGNMVELRADIQSLIDKDPGAHWDASTQTIVGSNAADWRNSARVVHIAMFNPDQLFGAKANDPLAFNNIALFFLEGAEGDGAQANIVGRFLYYASGGPTSGPETGSLVKTLRLVE